MSRAIFSKKKKKKSCWVISVKNNTFTLQLHQGQCDRCRYCKLHNHVIRSSGTSVQQFSRSFLFVADHLMCRFAVSLPEKQPPLLLLTNAVLSPQLPALSSYIITLTLRLTAQPQFCLPQLNSFTLPLWLCGPTTLLQELQIC